MQFKLSKKTLIYIICYTVMCIGLCYIAVRNTTAYNKFSCTLFDAFNDYVVVTLMLVVAILPSAVMFIFCEFTENKMLENISDTDWKIVILGLLGFVLSFWFIEVSKPAFKPYKIAAHRIMKCIDYGLSSEDDVNVRE